MKNHMAKQLRIHMERFEFRIEAKSERSSVMGDTETIQGLICWLSTKHVFTTYFPHLLSTFRTFSNFTWTLCLLIFDMLMFFHIGDAIKLTSFRQYVDDKSCFTCHIASYSTLASIVFELDRF